MDTLRPSRVAKGSSVSVAVAAAAAIRKPTAAMLGIHDRKRTESFPQLSFDGQIPLPASSIHNQFLSFWNKSSITLGTNPTSTHDNFIKQP
jgi:hypothetical protein